MTGGGTGADATGDDSTGADKTGAGKTGAPIPPLLLIGCGKMGASLFEGWVRQGLSPSFAVDPAGPKLPAPHRVVASLADLPPGFAPACVVLAVKPQMADEALAGLGARFPGALCLSIMAGRTLANMRGTSGAASWVRAMPNLPASVGQGATAAFASPEVTGPQQALAARLLAAVGTVEWLDDETLLDSVTAVSGSGPAYFFLLVEVLEAAGVQAGLPPAIARRLARRTLVGAGALMDASETDARAMREAVTSKGGTTERALSVFTRPGGLPDLVADAVAAAAARSRELES